MDKPLVSVVLPIYNVEKYLDRSIASVVNQTYKNLEIILVDDGSPDKCPEICDVWAQKDSRIKIIHKKNEGLGYARNTGIEHASGAYICFFDSDDYVENNTVESCVLAAVREQADIVCFGNDILTQNGAMVQRRIPSPPRYIYSGEEIRNIVMPNVLSYHSGSRENWNFSLSAWSALYSMDVIRKSGWRFVSEREIISEDIYSILELYQYIHKIVILPEVFYHYITNPVSLSRIYRPDRYEKIKYLAQKLTELSQQMDCFDLLRERIARIFLGLTIGVIKQIVAGRCPIKKKRTEINLILNDSYLQRVFHENDFSMEDFQKKILFTAMAQKKWFACYVIVGAKNRIDHFHG